MDQHNWPARSRSLIWEGEIARLEQDAVDALQRRLKAARQNLTDAHNKRPDLWQSPGLRNAIDDALRVVSGDVPTLGDAAKLGTVAGLDIATGEANLHGWGSLAGQFTATPNLSAAALVSAKSTDSIRKMRADLKRRILDTVSVGVLEGEGAYEIAKRVLGTGLKGLAGRDGVFRPAAHRAEGIARTTVNEAFNRAAVDQYDRLGDEYPELGLEYEWVSQLDSRTSLTCRTLNGRRRKRTEEFSAEGWTGKQGPAHPFCRSRVVAVVTKDAPKLSPPPPPKPKPAVRKPSGPPTNPWDAAWAKAPEDLKRAVGKLRVKLAPPDPTKIASYYPGQMAIQMGSNPDPSNPIDQGVYRHEMGHALDHLGRFGAAKARIDKMLADGGYAGDFHALRDELASKDSGTQKKAQGVLADILKFHNIPPHVTLEYLANRLMSVGQTFEDPSLPMASGLKEFEKAFRKQEREILKRAAQISPDSQKRINDTLRNNGENRSLDYSKLDYKAAQTLVDSVALNFQLDTTEKVLRDSPSKDLTDTEIREATRRALLDQLPPGSMARRLMEPAVNKSPVTPAQTKLLAKLALHPDSPGYLADAVDHYLLPVGKSLDDTAPLAPDLIGSLTANKVGYGHSDDYYAKLGIPGLNHGMRNTETFANLVALYGTGDPLILEYLTSQTGTAFKKFKEFLGEIK